MPWNTFIIRSSPTVNAPLVTGERFMTGCVLSGATTAGATGSAEGEAEAEGEASPFATSGLSLLSVLAGLGLPTGACWSIICCSVCLGSDGCPLAEEVKLGPPAMSCTTLS